MQKIYKYPLPHGRRVEVPKDSKLLHIAYQDEELMGWFEHSDFGDKEWRTFYVIATGQQFRKSLVYRATVMDGEYVWHIYEEK